MAERRIMKNLFDFTDESFEVGGFKYRLLSDVNPEEFVLWKDNFPVVTIIKMACTISSTKQTIFESYEPISRFEKAEDRAAIRLAIKLLEKQYQ